MKKYYQENKEEIKEQQKKYYQEHKEQRKEYVKKYCEEHKEQLKEKQSQKYICSCGKELNINSKSYHKKSLFHINNS